LLTDAEHAQRKVTERRSGVQLLAAHRPTAHLRRLGGGEPW